MAGVTFQGVSKIYPDGTRAVNDFNLEIEDGEFMVLVGPSGCGKTTALRMVAGLEEISEGVLRIGERVVNHMPSRERDIAMVFQSYALYPHLSVYDNIAFGLKLKKTPKAEIEQRVSHAAGLLGLDDYLSRKPRALSGGQRQRVAMGRAIVREPQAFLMDEPLSNLDAKLRVQMRAEISQIQSSLGVTTLYVTHDQVEAMTMGDRVAVIRKGELQQVASPQELYDRPVNLFVGGFIGSPAMNLLEATLEEGNGGMTVTVGAQRIALGDETLKARPGLHAYAGKPVILGIRPEDLEDAALDEAGGLEQRLKGKVALREALGSEIMAHVKIDARAAATEDTKELAKDAGTEGLGSLDHESGATMIGRFGARSQVKEGEPVEIAVDTRALHFFEPDSGLGIYDGHEREEDRVMRKHRLLLLLALLVGALSLLVAGCGGDDDESAGDGGTTEAATTEAENVTGSITIAGLWTGGEGESFQAVLDGFKEQYPDVNVTYQPAGEDLPTILATGVEGGNPPDLASLSSPGVIKSFVDKGSLQPIDFATDALADNYSESFVNLTTFDGKTYGVVFKGANKSTVWYNTQAFEDAGVEPPSTWDDLLAAGDTLKASGVTPYSVGAADGWTLTDLFENVYLRTAGGDKYDQLATHEIPWTDQSVKDALAEMAKIFQSDNMAGGTSSALQTDFPTSVTQVFTDPPKAAMVMEGDFVGTFINTETNAKVGEGADVFTFPSINDSPPVVVGAGDSIVMFKDSPAARAMITYLASAEAAELWAKRGGFSSPNKQLDDSVYPDETTRKLASELAQAETFRFDLSDLQPQVLNEALFAELANFVKDPSNIDGTTEKLEAAAKKAYP